LTLLLAWNPILRSNTTFKQDNTEQDPSGSVGINVNREAHLDHALLGKYATYNNKPHM